jgi:hypothetical protein
MSKVADRIPGGRFRKPPAKLLRPNCNPADRNLLAVNWWHPNAAGRSRFHVFSGPTFPPAVRFLAQVSKVCEFFT